MDISMICNALGNETRYRIVKAMKDEKIETCCNKIECFEKGCSVEDFVMMTGLAQSTVSQHLAVLEKSGLIVREKRSQWTCFFLNKNVLEEFFDEARKALLE